MQGRAQGPRSRSRRSRHGGTLARTLRLGAAASGLLALTAATVAGAAGLGLEVNRTVEGEVLQRTNATRRARGVPALDRSDALSSLAREHSCAMAREGFFGHRSPTQGDLGERMRRARTPFSRMAENVAYVYGSDPADVTVKLWMES